jgi:RHS repeat-associated protein
VKSPVYGNGNLLSDGRNGLIDEGRWVYLWDAENRLIQMESTAAAVTAGMLYTKLTFEYNWEGKRVARHVWRGGNSGSPTFLNSRRWLYEGWNPVVEFTGTSATAATGATAAALNRYTWGLDLGDAGEGIGRPGHLLQRAGGVGGLVLQTTISGGVMERPSYDGNGNIVAWTKSNASAPSSRREYDAFGNVVMSEGASPSAFGFSTKIEDAQTGLLYYGYRYYDPVTGRWPSRDPIGERGGVNFYGFVANNGVDSIDYLGLEVILIRVLSSEEKEGGSGRAKWEQDKQLYNNIIESGNKEIDEFIASVEKVSDADWEKDKWKWTLNPGNGNKGMAGFTIDGDSKEEVLKIAKKEKETRVIEYDGAINGLEGFIKNAVAGAGPYAKLIVMGHGMGKDMWFGNGTNPSLDALKKICSGASPQVGANIVSCLQDGSHYETVTLDPVPAQQVRVSTCAAKLRLFSANRYKLGGKVTPLGIENEAQKNEK